MSSENEVQNQILQRLSLKQQPASSLFRLGTQQLQEAKEQLACRSRNKIDHRHPIRSSVDEDDEWQPSTTDLARQVESAVLNRDSQARRVTQSEKYAVQTEYQQLAKIGTISDDDIQMQIECNGNVCTLKPVKSTLLSQSYNRPSVRSRYPATKGIRFGS